MPKVAILSNRENSAISHVLGPVARALGTEIHYYPFPNMASIEEYDLVHLGYLGLLEKEDVDRSTLISLNVWNISIERISAWLHDRWLGLYDHYVLDDTTTYQIMGQMGAENMTIIPLAFDASKFRPLPPPDTEFTVGIFCNDYPSKRYHIVYQACELAGVRCHFQVLSSNRTHYSVDPVRDVYAHIHVLAHASYTDTNSMPVQEALYCGRPAIATHNFGLHRVLEHGKNGYFYSGSAEDLAEKILLTKANYESLREGAISTPRPPLHEAIYAYRALFSKLLDGEELPLVQEQPSTHTIEIR